MVNFAMSACCRAGQYATVLRLYDNMSSLLGGKQVGYLQHRRWQYIDVGGRGPLDDYGRAAGGGAQPSGGGDLDSVTSVGQQAATNSVPGDRFTYVIVMQSISRLKDGERALQVRLNWSLCFAFIDITSSNIAHYLVIFFGNIFVIFVASVIRDDE